jgi:hypothetical protein
MTVARRGASGRRRGAHAAWHRWGWTGLHASLRYRGLRWVRPCAVMLLLGVLRGCIAARPRARTKALFTRTRARPCASNIMHAHSHARTHPRTHAPTQLTHARALAGRVRVVHALPEVHRRLSRGRAPAHCAGACMTVQHLATPQCDMLQHSTTSRNISSTPSSEACAGTSCAPHAAPPASCAQIARAARCCHDGALQMGFSVPFTIFHTLITNFRYPSPNPIPL